MANGYSRSVEVEADFHHEFACPECFCSIELCVACKGTVVPEDPSVGLNSKSLEDITITQIVDDAGNDFTDKSWIDKTNSTLLDKAKDELWEMYHSESEDADDNE